MENHAALPVRFAGKGLRRVKRRAIRRAADLRAVIHAFRFWQDCRSAACRRAGTCLGDPQLCFDPQAAARFSPGQMLWIREALDARARGLGWDEAKAAATRALARRLPESAGGCR